MSAVAEVEVEGKGTLLYWTLRALGACEEYRNFWWCETAEDLVEALFLSVESDEDRWRLARWTNASMERYERNITGNWPERLKDYTYEAIARRLVQFARDNEAAITLARSDEHALDFFHELENFLDKGATGVFTREIDGTLNIIDAPHQIREMLCALSDLCTQLMILEFEESGGIALKPESEAIARNYMQSVREYIAAQQQLRMEIA